MVNRVQRQTPWVGPSGVWPTLGDVSAELVAYAVETIKNYIAYANKHIYDMQIPGCGNGRVEDRFGLLGAASFEALRGGPASSRVRARALSRANPRCPVPPLPAVAPRAERLEWAASEDCIPTVRCL
jgi:hypothetical protein